MNPTYRYPGFRSFEDNDIDRRLFFGREKEKKLFFHKVLVNRLTVLFARSGLGKTSLINAGLNQALRVKGYTPLLIRLNNAAIDPMEQIYQEIKEIVKLENLRWLPEKIPWKLVLILDQFEEFFILYSPEIRQSFIKQMADLINNNIPDEVLRIFQPEETSPYSDRPPNIKIIISIREDFLGHLEEMADFIPIILNSRFRLPPLSFDQARQAINGPSNVDIESILTQPFTFTEEAVNEMLNFLCRRNERGKTIKTDEVESFQLQLLCRHIEEHIVPEKTNFGKGDIIIESAELGGDDGMRQVMERFYGNILDKFKPGDPRNRIRKLFEDEDGLISVSDRRLSLEQSEIERKFNVSEKELLQLINYRLLRSEPRVGSVYYELSHDTLILPIRKFQEKQQEQEDLLNKLSAEALSIEAGNPGAYEKLALEYIKNGAPVKAVEIYRQALNVAPEYADIYSNISKNLIIQGNENLAEDIYECTLKSGSKKASLYFDLGNRYRNLKKYNKAAAAFQTAFELDPENISTKINLVENYFLAKQSEKAGSLAKEVMEIKNISAAEKLAVHCISILSLLIQGKMEEADTQSKIMEDFYKSLPDKYERNWSYRDMESFILENKKLFEPNAGSLLELIKKLESPQKSELLFGVRFRYHD